MNYLLAGLAALGLSLASGFAALKLFPKLGLMDRPHKYGLARPPIPYPGGVLIYLNFLLLSLVFLEPNLKLAVLLAGGGLLVLVSFIDDRIGLPAPLRLFVQAVVAMTLVAGGIGVEAVSNPFGGQIDLSGWDLAVSLGDWKLSIMPLSALLTVFWIILVANTANWMDGIPGLTSGISAIGGLILFFLSISDLVRQPEVAMLALIVAMLALGFWCFDFFPPKILMGDSGSMFLGLMLATLAIFSGGKIATAFLILGFPILDLLYVVAYRLMRGQAPWKGGEWDRERKAVHLHHRLLKAGFSERQVLLLIYALSASYGIIALIVGTQGKFWAIVSMAALSVGLGVVLKGKNGVEKFKN